MIMAGWHGPNSLYCWGVVLNFAPLSIVVNGRMVSQKQKIAVPSIPRSSFWELVVAPFLPWCLESKKKACQCGIVQVFSFNILLLLGKRANFSRKKMGDFAHTYWMLVERLSIFSQSSRLLKYFGRIILKVSFSFSLNTLH